MYGSWACGSVAFLFEIVEKNDNGVARSKTLLDLVAPLGDLLDVGIVEYRWVRYKENCDGVSF